MPGIIDLNKISFGHDDAELDEKYGFLDKVFLKTSIYERAKRSERELVIGRKGSGKSAICLMLGRAFGEENVLPIIVSPQLLSPRRLRDLKSAVDNPELALLLRWKYHILVLMGKQVLAQAGETVELKRRSPIIRIRRFLVLNNEVERTLREKILLWRPRIARLSWRIPLVEGDLETQQQQQQNEADISRELTQYQSDLAEGLAILQKRIVILIDKVDELWFQSGDSSLVIIALVGAVHDLNGALPHSHIILFLRSDIYDTLKFNDADKYHSLEERLRWNARDLKHMLTMRARISGGLSIDDVDAIWNGIFAEQIQGRSSFDYILARTMRRPRDLIQFCNSARTEAVDQGHNHILEQDVLAAESQFSRWKLRDLASEFIIQYPFLEELLGFFRGVTSDITKAQVEAIHEHAKLVLAKYSELHASNLDLLLSTLFNIGFLGVRVDQQELYTYDDPNIAIGQQEVFTIHPAFHMALNISNENGGFSGIADLALRPDEIDVLDNSTQMDAQSVLEELAELIAEAERLRSIRMRISSELERTPQENTRSLLSLQRELSLAESQIIDLDIRIQRLFSVWEETTG